MKIAFAGSSIEAAACLNRLAEAQDVRIVLTKPDARRGRGMKKMGNPVKELAESLGIRAWEGDPGSAEFLQECKDMGVECGAVVAYGKIIPPHALSSLPKGWYNLHFSLLPYFRGANPVAACILDKFSHCGLTVFKLTPGLDEGPYILKEPYSPPFPMTAAELKEELAGIGKNALAKAMEMVERGNFTLTEQSDAPDLAKSKKIGKGEAKIDFSKPKEEVFYKVLACNPNPMGWANARIGTLERRVKINRVNLSEISDHGSPGSTMVKSGKAYVKCSDGWLELAELTPESKKKMRGSDWLRGLRSETSFF